jgi:hypothetical protein
MANSKSEIEKKETEKRLIFILAVLLFIIPVISRSWI